MAPAVVHNLVLCTWQMRRSHSNSIFTRSSITDRNSQQSLATTISQAGIIYKISLQIDFTTYIHGKTNLILYYKCLHFQFQINIGRTYNQFIRQNKLCWQQMKMICTQYYIHSKQIHWLDFFTRGKDVPKMSKIFENEVMK